MALSWQTRTTLIRLGGIVDELLASARSTPALRSDPAFAGELGSLTKEIQEAVARDDAALADEFHRVVLASDLPPDLRAAALAGWLKAGLAVESLEEQRASSRQAQPPPRRKQTLGFKIRSPITRETASGETPPPR